MPTNRKARRETDPGLQPERTSLAWFRTLLGYGALMALALRHSWQHSGSVFWTFMAVLTLAAAILWRYTRNRILMDVDSSDFALPGAIRDKLLIALAVFSLALLFAVTHLRQLFLLI
ncbi:DUF202 domain-containing protein [Salmonella enterica]